MSTINKHSKKLLAIVTSAVLTMPMAVLATSPDSEEACLLNGKIAGTTSKMMKMGAPAQDIKNILLRQTANNPSATKENDMIVDYVYAMQLGAEDANKLVYLKCKAGEYQ